MGVSVPSVPKQRIHDFFIGCGWAMCERVGMEIVLAGQQASAEKNLGAQCWIFSDQRGPVTARIDQVPLKRDCRGGISSLGRLISRQRDTMSLQK